MPSTAERRLQEVLTDFWFNHFNVDARKIEDKPVVVEYEREVIRPRVFGKFREHYRPERVRLKPDTTTLAERPRERRLAARTSRRPHVLA